MEEFREGLFKSFINVEGAFERNEKVSRIGAMLNKKKRKDGISHTKFIAINGNRIHLESRAKYRDGLLIYEHIIRSVGLSTQITRDKTIALDIIREYGGYKNYFWKNQQ